MELGGHPVSTEMESGGHPVSTVIRLKFVVPGSYKLTSKTGGGGQKGGSRQKTSLPMQGTNIFTSLLLNTCQLCPKSKHPDDWPLKSKLSSSHTLGQNILLHNLEGARRGLNSLTFS